MSDIIDVIVAVNANEKHFDSIQKAHYENARIVSLYVSNSMSKKKISKFTSLYDLPWDQMDLSGLDKPKKKIAISQVPLLFPEEFKI